MRSSLPWVIVVAGVLSFSGSERLAQADVAWRKSFAIAKAEAQKTHRLLFVEFTVPGWTACFVTAANLAFFLKAGLVAPERAERGGVVPWMKSFAEAESASRASGKPLFVYVWNYGWLCSAQEAGSLLNDALVIDAIRRNTVPVRLLLGHRIDPQHVTYFPDALKIGERLGVRSDPAYVLVGPDGTVRWRHVGFLTKDDLLRTLCDRAISPAARSPEASLPCAPAQPPSK